MCPNQMSCTINLFVEIVLFYSIIYTLTKNGLLFQLKRNNFAILFRNSATCIRDVHVTFSKLYKLTSPKQIRDVKQISAHKFKYGKKAIRKILFFSDGMIFERRLTVCVKSRIYGTARV